MMKTLVSIAALLFSAAPILADDVVPAFPPTPPAADYEVWGFHWEGQQYVKQPKYSFRTPDLKKASDYVSQINGFAGWTATSNIPQACVESPLPQFSRIGRQQPLAFPAPTTFTIWAFKLTDGAWVKDDKYCWTTTDPVKGIEYANKVNAVSSWRATYNLPLVAAPKHQHFVYGNAVPGGIISMDLQSVIRDARNGPLRGMVNRDGSYSNSNSTWNIQVESPPYDNTNDIQNMIHTQNMINTQNMLNTQDMINTQNMVNNIQDMVNTQNMINAMQPTP